jgi:hypothetical protein
VSILCLKLFVNVFCFFIIKQNGKPKEHYQTKQISLGDRGQFAYFRTIAVLRTQHSMQSLTIDIQS